MKHDEITPAHAGHDEVIFPFQSCDNRRVINAKRDHSVMLCKEP
jgi:hypothetical protein